MSDLKSYEVIRKNCLSYDVGQVVELTDKRAKSLVNKVKLIVKKEVKQEVKQKGNK